MGNTNPFVLQLIPSSVGGVSDYANVLKSGGLDGAVVKLTEGDRPTFRGGETVLLHYSGYGYARRGAPLWLLHWLREERPRIRRLGVFFHELYANGPPWKSEFWLSPLQRHVARQMELLADFWITNRFASSVWLGSNERDRLGAVLPTPSGVGEAAMYVPSYERSRKLIVFGGVGLRTATYRAWGGALMKWAAEREVTIHDVGPTVADTTIQEFIAGAGVVCHGRLEADRVSALLGQCLFGALTYSTAYAAKSSVLGAYCAHGVCPIIFPDPNYPGNSLDGLLHGVNVYDGSRLTQLDFDMAAKVGAGAFDWYLPHNVERHVATIRSLQNGDAFA